ncbi:MAG TPA: chemotaxis protein CheA [Candidatus Syntrophoarchaeum butanivorans]|uniref:Chemotaxis protein CheA n=2 Tax=Candidatus Syntropharchaeum butanivorans TaxID=1839936 RepID=A0A1F2P3U2_9EURY|nr:MAG: chemotaxis protein CheA [Candidatus Syntrophoarchaeum butanivorans]HEC56535.1 chemotaxis protein CheA [Candidatus Syntrophoarchaeum butanivorans]
MTDLDISQYKDEFIGEAREHLQVMNEALLNLEHEPGNIELLNRIFRAAHTLKGSSATLGFTKVSELTHKMENVLDEIRNHRLKVTPDLLDLIFESFDALETLVDDIDAGRESEIDVNGLIERLIRLTEEEGSTAKEEMPEGDGITEKGQRTVNAAVNEDPKLVKISVTLDEGCALKGVRAFMVLKKLKERGEVVETIPPMDAIENGAFERGFTVLLGLRDGQVDYSQLASEISGMNEIADVVVEEFEKEPVVPSQDQPKPVNKPPKKPVVENVQSVRVNIEKLDTLVNLVGELVISKIRLKDLEGAYELKELDETITTIDRLVTELRDEVMQMRMVPVRQVFNRFPRMVRDLARKKGKKIRFEMEGGDIELDRTVLDEIGEPLVHLLRNAVDHGIEAPDVRTSAGKNPEGTVRLVASREKSQVLIEVIDDGAGIDPAKIRESAVRKGLITREEADKLTDEEAQALIFMPGFSTAENVSDISGRGVGMDVVKTKIESLGGSIALESRVGEGTKIAMKLPLTMAIVQAMLVEVADQIFAIPINSVVEVMVVPRKEVHLIGKGEVTTLRGNVLPLIRMHDLMNLPHPESGELTVVVVERSSKQIGLVVDGIIGQQEVVIKTMGDLLKSVKGFAGATILGDGRVILILDIGSLI